MLHYGYLLFNSGVRTQGRISLPGFGGIPYLITWKEMLEVRYLESTRSPGLQNFTEQEEIFEISGFGNCDDDCGLISKFYFSGVKTLTDDPLEVFP